MTIGIGSCDGVFKMIKLHYFYCGVIEDTDEQFTYIPVLISGLGLQGRTYLHAGCSPKI